jgi:hypothetical protein
MTDKTDVMADVREFTGYTSELVLSQDGLKTAYKRAKRHVEVKKSLPPDFIYFSPEKPEVENALFWWTCIFVKVVLGDLDGEAVQAGAVDENTLLAKDDNAVTVWHREATDALDAMLPEQTMSVSRPSRSERSYNPGNFTTGDDAGSGSTVDADDFSL